MSTGFYHGNETKEQDTNEIIITGADMSIVGIIGTAPVFMLDEADRNINKAVCINNYAEKSKYVGENISGFTLPDAVETVLTESEGAKIYIVNVFDPAKHKADLTTTKTFKNGEIRLDEKGIFNLVISKNDAALALDVDYSFNNNTISIVDGGALADKDSVSISYSYADLTKVTAGDIIGAVDKYGAKSGMKALEDVESIYGDQIGILICPSYDGLVPVSSSLESLAAELDAFTYTDAQYGTTQEQAIQGRGSKGEINFNTVCKDCMLIVPYVGRYNSYQDVDELKPLSPVYAGLRVLVDREEGIQASISNHPLKTVTRLEYPIDFRMGKTNTAANNLNSKGISCVINFRGYRSFGTRSANFPSESGIETFECCRRVDKYIQKSILNATFTIVDKSITSGLINCVCDSINAFLDTLKDPLRQTIIDGRCWYDPSLNKTSELANGWVKFCYEFVAPPPAERITFYRTININLLNKIGAV